MSIICQWPLKCIVLKMEGKGEIQDCIALECIVLFLFYSRDYII